MWCSIVTNLISNSSLLAALPSSTIAVPSSTEVFTNKGINSGSAFRPVYPAAAPLSGSPIKHRPELRKYFLKASTISDSLGQFRRRLAGGSLGINSSFWCCTHCAKNLHCTMWKGTALYCIVLQCTALYFKLLNSTVLNFIVMNCTVLHCTYLDWTLVHSTSSYCTAL